jgi:hypothetical protein
VAALRSRVSSMFRVVLICTNMHDPGRPVKCVMGDVGGRRFRSNFAVSPSDENANPRATTQVLPADVLGDGVPNQTPPLYTPVLLFFFQARPPDHLPHTLLALIHAPRDTQYLEDNSSVDMQDREGYTGVLLSLLIVPDSRGLDV